jgi:hypothetical protein
MDQSGPQKSKLKVKPLEPRHFSQIFLLPFRSPELLSVSRIYPYLSVFFCLFVHASIKRQNVEISSIRAELVVESWTAGRM